MNYIRVFFFFFYKSNIYCTRLIQCFPDLGRHAELLSQILYNHGLVLLSTQQPALAHSCWHISALFQQHTTNRPRFWIRLAECCVTHHLLLVGHKYHKSTLTLTRYNREKNKTNGRLTNKSKHSMICGVEFWRNKVVT